MLNEMKSNVFIGLLHDILAEPKSLNHVSRLLYAILTSSEILEAQPFQSRYLKNIFESKLLNKLIYRASTDSSVNT